MSSRKSPMPRMQPRVERFLKSASTRGVKAARPRPLLQQLYVETTPSPVAVKITALRFSSIRKELHARRDNGRPLRTPPRAASRRREPAGVPRLHHPLGNRGGVPPQAQELDSGTAGHLLRALRYPDDRIIAGGDRRARRRASLGCLPLGAGRLRRRLARFPVRGRSPAHERHGLWPDAQLRQWNPQTLWREDDVFRSARRRFHRGAYPARNPGDLSRIARLAHFRSAGRPSDRGSRPPPRDHRHCR